MKRLFAIISIFVVFLISQVYAQTPMGGCGGVNSTLTQCGGTYADPGGNANYGNNANCIQTICPGTAGQCVTIQFTSFSLESNFDYLYVYNGTTTAAPLMGTYTGTTIPNGGNLTATNASGCLTLRFTSDGSVTSPGWLANVICAPCGSPPPPPPGPTVASDCSGAVNICTNSSFQIDPNGSGSVVEFTSGSVSNPSANPGSANSGCLLSGELNSTWMVVNIATTGTLEFSFGADAGTGCLDWIMWPYNGPTTCTQIINNSLPPIRCNWNGACESFTGIATPLPAGGAASNFEPELNVTCGQRYLICLSNYSSQTTSLPLNFFGTASVSCSTFTPITVNNATICPGASATLTAAGGNTYTWSPSTGLSATTGATVTASPATTTTYTVTGTGACGTGTATSTVTVLAANDPACGCTATASNTGPYCAGGTIQLNGTGGGTYSWSGPNGFTSTLQNPTLPATAAAAGVYTLTTNLSGCIATATTTVVVNPVATANANIDQSLCAGGTINLNGSFGGGATSGTWSAPSGSFSSATSMTSTYTPSITTGTVTLTLTTNDPAGPCPAVTDQMIVTVNPLPTVNAGADQTVCAGTSVTLAATGATTYSWTGGVTQGVAFIPSSTATYTVTGTTAAGCTSTDQVIVTVNPIPVVNAGPDVPICAGGSTTLTATGATSYSWSPGGQTTASITVSPASTTTYTVTGTSLGCTASDAVIVTVNANAPINAGLDVAICTGQSTTITATGGNTYNWTGLGAGASFTVSPTSTTTYTVVGTNAAGCTGTDQVVVTVNPLPTVNAGLDQTVCAGATVTLTASGATTYTWNNGVSQGVSFVPSATTTYTVTGTTAAGCTSTDQVLVTVNPIPSVNAGPDLSVCTGTSVTLTGSGAATYSWNNGVTNGTAFVPASTTTYTVTGTSAAGCIATDQVTVTVLSNAPINAGPDVAICQGQSTTLTATGGSTYNWNNGLGTGNNFTVSPSVTTTYTVVGTDANGCTGTDNIIVTVNPLPTTNAGADQTVCQGTTVTLTATGASTYSWNNGVTQGVAFTPSVGTTTYTVTGTTAAGCIATDQVVVTVNPLPTTNAGPDQTVCAGTSVTLTATGAASYSWSGGVNQGVAFTPTATTTYTVTGTSAAGCTTTDQVLVTVNPLPLTNAGPDQTVCSGTSVTLTATGASTYSWNNGVTNGIAFTPAVGTVTYTVTGTSAAGCIATDQVTVTVNPNPSPVINGPTNYCIGNTATLGTSTPFTTYAWSTGASTPTVNVTQANNPITVTVTNGFGCQATSAAFNVIEDAVITANFSVTICQGQSAVIHGITRTVAGTYSQTFTSATGCDSISNVTLNVNPLPPVNAGVDQTVCTPTQTTLTATGAATYTWNNGVTNGVPFTQAVGTTTYTVSGTDANGCVNTDQVNITVNPLPVINAGNDQAVCIGQTVTLSGTGGTTYTWNNGVSNGVAFTPSVTTTYTVTGTNANGCVNTDQVVVTVNPLPIVNAGQDQAVCAGTAVTLSGSGAVNYTWNNGVSNGVAFIPAATTTYTVTGTNANGCINTDQVLVTVNNNPTVSAGPDQTVCVGTSVTLSGTGASTYTWNNGVNNGVSFIPAATATYTVTGTTAAGCTGTDQVLVTVNPLPNVGAGPDQAVCIGGNVTLNGTGASTYTWTNGVTNGVSFIPGATATYIVSGTDANGCVNTDQVVVTVNPLPNVNAGQDLEICIGEQATLAGSGAVNYSWNNGITNGIPFSPTTSGVYTVTGTDANGCVNTDQVTVTVNPLPAVNAGPDQTVCLGTQVTLSGSGAVTYSWNNGISNGVAFTPAAGTVSYTVTGTDANGCINNDQVNVTVNPLPSINAGPDQSVCEGIQVTLTATGGVNYSWSGGVVNGLAFNSPVGTNTYTVTGTDANGCVNTDQVNVTVNPLPTVFAGNDVVICDGETVTLTGSGAASYTWDNGVINGIGFAPAVGTVTYTVTGTTLAGCIDSDQVDVTVNPNPVVSFTPGATLGCAPLLTTLTNTTPDAANCVWTISNGTVMTGCGTIPVEFTQSGCYDVTLTTTASNGCTSSMTADNLICVEEPPIAAFAPSANQISTLNTEILFDNESTGATQYIWTFGVDNETSDLENPTYVYPSDEEGQYTVTLIASSPLGCLDTAISIITVYEELIFYVPNTFTPDEDNYNPTFKPIFTSGFDPQDYVLYIYNRWGELIFESHNAEIGWDGSYGTWDPSPNQIEMCQDGTYTWKIEFKVTRWDERKVAVGHVNLIR